MVAAFGDLQVGVVVGRQLDTLGRQQVNEGIMGLGQMLVHLVHDLLGGMRPRHRQHLRMRSHHHIFLGAQAAGDDYLAVFIESFADGIERLFHCGIDEATGVDDHEIRPFIGRGDLIALRAQAREDVFGINQGLGAT